MSEPRPLPATGAAGSRPAPPRSVLHRAHLARVDHRDPDRATRVAPWVRRLAWTLDESVPLPFGRRTGLDGIIGLIPGVGDLAGLLAGLVVVVAGAAADVSLPTLVRMLWNTTLAAVVGLVPFAGDMFDMAFKANMRNLALIEADLGDRVGTRRRSWLMIGLVVGAVLLTALVVVLAVAVAATVVVGRLLG